MNVKKKVFDLLLDRQINIRDQLNSNFYRNEIIKTYYDSSKMFKYVINKPNIAYSCFNFSNDGKYMISGLGENIEIWDFDKANFSESSSIKALDQCGKLLVDSNKDFSKVFACSYRKFDIVDVSKAKSIVSIQIPSIYNEVVTLDPINQNFACFGYHEKLRLLDLRSSSIQKINKSYFHEQLLSIQYHPSKENLLLISSDKNGVHLFDIRNYRNVLSYDLFGAYANYNRRGDQILVLKNGFDSVIIDSKKTTPLFELNDYGYYSSLETKNYCFAGENDEYIVSSSNNFNIYMWEIPKKIEPQENSNGKFIKKIDSAKFILKGHRSVIQEIHYNYQKSVIVSYGNDGKIILWSVFPFDKNFEQKSKDFSDDTSHERLINLRIKGRVYDEINPDIFDNSLETSFMMSVNDRGHITFLFFWVWKFFVMVDFEDAFGFKKFDFKNCENDFTKFENNSFVMNLNSLIIYYESNGKKVFSKLSMIIDDVIDNELKKNSECLHMQQLSIIFEIRKIFDTKNFISDSISLMDNQLKLLRKENKISCCVVNGNNNYEFLSKIEKAIDFIVKKLSIIYDENIELFKKSIYLFNLIFSKVLKISFEEKSSIEKITNLDLKEYEEKFKTCFKLYDHRD